MIRTGSLKLILCLLTVAVLNGALCACAAVGAYRKCGFAGCPGDSEITAKVEDRFARYPVLEPPNLIRVQTYDRVVFLSGVVSTPPQRDLAESVAGGVSGVRKVINSINLDYQGL